MFEFLKRSNPFEQRAKSVRDIRKEWGQWDKRFDTKGKAVISEEEEEETDNKKSENHHIYSPYKENKQIKYDKHGKLPPV